MNRQDKRRGYDAKRREAAPYRAWYKLKAWHRIRAKTLKAEPACRFHKAQGVIVPSTTVDHVEPHNGDWLAFWRGPFQALCADCHDRHKQREERIGFSVEAGADGWPVDPRHPANRRNPYGD